jgi:hypothetical protein
MDEQDQRIANAISDLTTPIGAAELREVVIARTRTRSRRGPFLLGSALLLVIIGFGITRGVAPLDPRQAAVGIGSSPAIPSVISAADLAPCGQQLVPADVEALVQLPAASDFGDRFPVYKDHIPTEAATAAAAYVVILRGQYPVEALRRAAPPPGQSWPPEPTLAPGHRDVCLVIPGVGNGTGIVGRPLVVIYADVDTKGFQP